MYFCTQNTPTYLIKPMNLLNIGIHFPITDPTWIFFLVLMIILFAPILLGRLRIPHIIGMILAGVAIGPYGFNILERDSSFELFGKVGIYYIMFLALQSLDRRQRKGSSRFRDRRPRRRNGLCRRPRHSSIENA